MFSLDIEKTKVHVVCIISGQQRADKPYGCMKLFQYIQITSIHNQITFFKRLFYSELIPLPQDPYVRLKSQLYLTITKLN